MLAVVVPSGLAGKAYVEASSAILCDCGCHPQSVKDCACSHAEEMRSAIAAEASSGTSGEAIITSYVARFGEQILVTPRVEGFNLVAWLGPGVALVVAIAGVALLIRRWRGGTSVASTRAPERLDDADPHLVRLRREVEEHR